MMPKSQILIVENEMIIAADVSNQLSKLGYQIIGINTKGEDAISSIENNPPDIVLMDITLAGQMNGIQAAEYIIENFQIPLIFLTSNTDNATFQEAVAVKPYAFIAKPFQEQDLQRAFHITEKRIMIERVLSSKKLKKNSEINDRILIKPKAKYKSGFKIFFGTS
ncbi:MAG: response regulator [Saprospiraceae bacterium]